MSDTSENKPGWTLADIADYTGKSTSAVSNWRKRFEDTFPKPISRDGVALVFSPLEVQKWLEINEHLMRITLDTDRFLSFELKNLEKNVWSSIDVVRGKIPPNQFFYFFTDAIAYNFDLNVKKSKQSLWTTFVDTEAKTASRLRETWFDFFARGSVNKSQELLKLLHLIPGLTGFDKSGLEHLTSIPLSQTVARIVDARDSQIVIDPCVGLGTLLLETANASVGTPSLFGREINSLTAQTARTIFIYSGIEAVIEEGDSVRGSQIPVGDRVVAAPPLNQRFNFSSFERKDVRWDYADPGSDGGDIAWAQIVLGSMKDTGIGAMITSHAILFRSGRTETFRRRLVGRGHLEAVITFPGGLLYGTRIPCAILVFNKDQKSSAVNEGVLFMDVSINNRLKLRSPISTPAELPSAVANVVLAHRNGNEIKHQKNQEFEIRCIKVRQGVLAENEFNLLPTRYIGSNNQGRSKKEIEGMINQVESRIAELSKQLEKRRNSIQNERSK